MHLIMTKLNLANLASYLGTLAIAVASKSDQTVASCLIH